MILFLRGLFLVVIVSMLGVTSWATLHQSLGEFARGPVIRDPWVVATLFDAYWAFITFYVWLAWKEQSLAARVLWFPAIVLLGNLAMSAYLLVQLFSVPQTGLLADVFTRRRTGGVALPAALSALAVGIYLLA
ncbi:MAG TPA: DUF1475 family protein [Opitutaceae bacterium]|nr:DUF1475 family protein [Opitutaceae bacterium]